MRLQTFAVAVVLLAGCGDDAGDGGGGGGAGSTGASGTFAAGTSASGTTTSGTTASATSASGTSASSTNAGGTSSTSTGAGGGVDCASDPLATGLVAEQNGISVDVADCAILTWVAAYAEPDPMIVKAMIYGESRFDYAATGCPNLPCGTPDGWTEAESYCYGMMQVVPACGPIADGAGLLPNGHPNLTLDTASPDFAGSIYNPDVNIHVGVAGFAGNRAEVKGLYPGCTEDQYTLMALGNLASHGSTTGCTEYNTDYIDYILPAYFQYCEAAGYAPHDY